MSRQNYFKIVSAFMNCVVLSFLLFRFVNAQTTSKSDLGSAQSIVVRLFLSSECPFCENVKELVDDLNTQLPIKTEMFDIDRPNDYDLYCKIEETHKNAKFAVPLVVIGDTILIGQSEILAKLESTIKSMEASGQTNQLSSKPERPENSKPTRKSSHSKFVADSEQDHQVQHPTQNEIRSSKIKIINDDHN